MHLAPVYPTIISKPTFSTRLAVSADVNTLYASVEGSPLLQCELCQAVYSFSTTGSFTFLIN